jgi:hypothetical protein
MEIATVIQHLVVLCGFAGFSICVKK